MVRRPSHAALPGAEGLSLGAQEIVEGLSGDEVDPRLIIAGGRRTRAAARGAAVPRYQASKGGLDDDDDDE